jgi:hypothetical protein
MVRFNSPTSAAIVVQQVTQPPPPLHSINLGISLAVEAVVAHALEKRREARPQTAAALAEELSAAVQGIPVSLPASRIESNAISFTPNSGGAAPALAPTMQMSGVGCRISRGCFKDTKGSRAREYGDFETHSTESAQARQDNESGDDIKEAESRVG